MVPVLKNESGIPKELDVLGVMGEANRASGEVFMLATVPDLQAV